MANFLAHTFFWVILYTFLVQMLNQHVQLFARDSLLITFNE